MADTGGNGLEHFYLYMDSSSFANNPFFGL
jgi:hypothetical protein